MKDYEKEVRNAEETLDDEETKLENSKKAVTK